MVVTVKVQWHGKKYYKCKLQTQARNYSREPKKASKMLENWEKLEREEEGIRGRYEVSQ